MSIFEYPKLYGTVRTGGSLPVSQIPTCPYASVSSDIVQVLRSSRHHGP